MNNISNKKFFKNYGIFLLILIVSFLTLIYMVYLSKGFWRDNLQDSVETVLEEKQPGTWIMGDFIELKNPMATNAAAYNVVDKNGNEAKAVILRIITFYGPVSGVYIMHSESDVEFIGFCSIHGRIAYQLGDGKNDIRVEYWAKRIPELFEQEVVEVKRRSIYVFVSATLAMIVPAPGRFVYGLVLIVLLNFLMLLGNVANSIVKKFDLRELQSTVIFTFILCGTIFFRQLMIFLNPEVVLTLGFVMYLTPVSFFVIGYLFNNSEDAFKQRIKFSFTHSLTFSVYALFIFIIRDIFGYGTFTYFGSNFQIVEKVLFPEDSLRVLSFIASVPGVLILSSVILFFHIMSRNKLNIIKNTDSIKEEKEEGKK